MPKRIRLLAPAQIDGQLLPAGSIVTLADGVRGPHRAVHKTHDRIDYGTDPEIDANRIAGEIEDQPLYVELDDGRVPRVRLIGNHHTIHEDGAILEVVHDDAAASQSTERVTIRHARHLVAIGQAEWVGDSETFVKEQVDADSKKEAKPIAAAKAPEPLAPAPAKPFSPPPVQPLSAAAPPPVPIHASSIADAPPAKPIMPTPPSVLSESDDTMTGKI
jgi:hypothetical protein